MGWALLGHMRIRYESSWTALAGPSIWYHRWSSLAWLNILQAVQTWNYISFGSYYHIWPSKRMSIVGPHKRLESNKNLQQAVGLWSSPIISHYQAGRLKTLYFTKIFYFLARGEAESSEKLDAGRRVESWDILQLGPPVGCHMVVGIGAFRQHISTSHTHPQMKCPNNSFPFSICFLL